jgi:hypothetical protein
MSQPIRDAVANGLTDDEAVAKVRSAIDAGLARFSRDLLSDCFEEDDICGICGRRSAVILGGLCRKCDREEPQDNDYKFERIA